MIPNYDKKENIHYGVISIHNLNEFAYDGFEPENYISCPSCGKEFDEVSENLICNNCNYETDYEEFFYNETGESIYEDDNYILKLDEYNDIFIIKSPYYTFCKPCSPCAPNAGYILHEDKENGIKTYCLDKTWFEDEKTPYEYFEIKK
jgi:hypothetical protein